MPRAAREHVRVARRLPELPLIHAAFARGELSYAKVRALTRVADRECETDLLRLARALNAAQLERAIRVYRRVTTAQANALHADAYLATLRTLNTAVQAAIDTIPPQDRLLLTYHDSFAYFANQ